MRNACMAGAIVLASLFGRFAEADEVTIAAPAPVVASTASAAATRPAASSGDPFHRAAEMVRSGDFPGAIALYGELAAGGRNESASLLWNWAQAATARGSLGEALWALLRAREVEPGDRAIGREIERVREALNLDAAEVAPVPLSAVARASRRFRLDLVALALLALSLVFHLAARVTRISRWPVAAGWFCGVVGLTVALVPIVADQARPTGVVVRRGAPMVDAASPSAEVSGNLREGEVVPILAWSGDYVRIEDSSGARGWALADDVRRLDRPPSR